MKMSCNGCRILRKGCSEDCSIKPCLQWIKTPESQANATVFLAKFYGRTGLMNLINSGPHHLRPSIFRSLLFEACGRIVNPIYGSVGLLWSGSWQLCQTAVETVLKGLPITPITCEAAANGHGPPLKAYDIRHVSKDENSKDLKRPKTSRYRFKRLDVKPKPSETWSGGSGIDDAAAAARLGAKRINYKEFKQSTSSHGESSLSHQSEADDHVDADVSKETVLFGDELEGAAHERADEPVEESELALELTLGQESSSRATHVVPVKKRKVETSSFGDGACRMELGLACDRAKLTCGTYHVFDGRY